MIGKGKGAPEGRRRGFPEFPQFQICH